ncbi:hypothetical protein [Caballeronia sp. LZ019]|uniref:hypothetical protein n=1 Tax=Caballeronia sp. LZ019 TaxID=3038555 RepID=UPI00285D2702|nr:hypothetical protein [Caballeronia sp. LZ019]MDR5810860.1 hypothetical protein [Caballeronia sp. LZ019]
MKDRDVIAEIQEKRKRSFGKYMAGRSELQDIDLALECRGDSSVFNSLSIVGIAACIEVSVRKAIEKLVDDGAPYIDRVDKLKNKLHFDLRLTKALSDREITFGNLVSHLLPISSLSDIASHLETLLNGNGVSKSLATWLSEIQPFVESEDEALSSEDLFEDSIRRGRDFDSFAMRPVTFPLDNVSAILADIERIFVIRHIVAHEADFSVTTLQQIDALLGSATKFTSAIYELVEQTLHPEQPRSAVRISIRDARQVQQFYETIIGRENEAMRAMARRGESGFSGIGHLQRTSRAFSNYVDEEVRLVTANSRARDLCNLRTLKTNARRSLYEHRYDRLTNFIDDEVAINDFILDYFANDIAAQ